MNDLGSNILDEVFGPGDGALPEERAAHSKRLFVRGLDLLTFDSPRAKGRRLSAQEALDAYGFDKLCEIVQDGSAVITNDPADVGRTLRERRDQLGITIRTVASMSNLPAGVIEALEASKRRPVREYERVARILGLDDRLISFNPDPQDNEKVAVRLRRLSADRPALSSSIVAALAEASWVAMTQIRLEQSLGLNHPQTNFSVSKDYGSQHGRPAYRVGYDLADMFRRTLGLSSGPIPSLRELVEIQLAVPVIQAPLGERIAGATVQSVSGRRAIVLNIHGKNADACVRRSTMAHELCHLLFDPSDQLRDLRVDEYSELDDRDDTRADPVEQRANAFAVQLLAPQSEALARYRVSGKDDLHSTLDYFGISFTAGRYQIWNAMKRSVPLESIFAPNQAPVDDWDARETYTLAYHPIRSLTENPSRAGRFSAIVVRAASVGIISWDTAAEWLFCTEDDAKRAESGLRVFYADVFPAARAS
jgi:Zn-dependent peptidase ImmA (M78 family)/transcriptional regulator with XRE-family HTH domain